MDFFSNSALLSRINFVFWLVIIIFVYNSNTLTSYAVSSADLAKLKKGEVITTSLSPQLEGNLKGAEAKILLNAPVQEVWALLADQENLPRIVTKIKDVKVLEQSDEFQKVEASIKICSFLPTFKYTLLLDQREKFKRVKFSKVDGCFKELYGIWELEPYNNGTILTYRMFIDTGFFIPEFIRSQGLRQDLPDILNAIKKEVEQS